MSFKAIGECPIISQILQFSFGPYAIFFDLSKLQCNDILQTNETTRNQAPLVSKVVTITESYAVRVF